MRLPNGYGSVTKLSGKRRNPYMARITTGMEYDPVKQDYVQKRAVLGYYHTKAEALEALGEYSKNPYSILESTMTVKELWKSIKDKVDASDNRKVVYDRVFDKYMKNIQDMRIKDVKTRHLQQVIDDCAKGYSTKSNIRVVMNHIFRYAAQNDLVEKNYTDFIKFEQEETILEREVYTSEEIKKLWEKSDIEEYALTLVLLYQGMRIKEFMDLSPDDIDLLKKTINIKQGKNSYSVRTIPINKAVYDLVRRFKAQPVTLTRPQYYHFCKKILNHTPYDVRHTFATKCNKLGIDKLLCQRIMGHKPDSILEQVYTHLTMEELSDAINRVCY
jgi:integrase